MDDIVVKSRKAEDLVSDLKIAFKCLREREASSSIPRSVCSGSPEACSWDS